MYFSKETMRCKRNKKERIEMDRDEERKVKSDKTGKEGQVGEESNERKEDISPFIPPPSIRHWIYPYVIP